MCNEVARRIALGQLREDWSQLKVPLTFPEGLPNLAPLDQVRITDSTLILRTAPDGVEGTIRRWSWPGPTRKPVYNYRSEGRAFANAGASGRCLIPVDAFYEFTDPQPDQPAADLPLSDHATAPTRRPSRAKKTKWRFTATGANPGSPQSTTLRGDHSGSPQSTTLPGLSWFCIAGFWRTEPALGEGTAAEAFTLLTCEPGLDIAPYHHRQIVLPPPEQWAGWLDGSLPASEVCRPAAAGRFAVERAG